MTVEAGSPERRRVGLGRRVDVGAPLDEEAHDGAVARRSGTPERWCAFDCLAVKGHGA